MHKLQSIAMLFIACLLPVQASATPITYIERVIGSGSLGSTSFVDVPLTITAQSDTTYIVPSRFGVDAGALFPTVTIGNLGSFAITGGYPDTSIFAYNEFFGGPYYAVSIVFIPPSNHNYFGVRLQNNDVFSHYFLDGSIGPVTAEASLGYVPSVATSGGLLTLTRVQPTGTFQAELTPATITPEPSSFTLLGTGLLCVAGMVRKRSR